MLSIYLYIYTYYIYTEKTCSQTKSLLYIFGPQNPTKMKVFKPAKYGLCSSNPVKNEGTMGSHGWYLPCHWEYQVLASPDSHRCQASENLKNNGQFLLGAPSEKFSMWNARRFWDGMFSLVYVNLEKKNGSVTGSVTHALDGMFQMCQAV